MSEHQATAVSAAADEPVDIAHLVATAVQQQQQQQQDPLPTAEEIEAAKAASVAAAAHSTCSAAAVPGQAVKGLGGAGLHPKRGKGGRGPGSTISAATAPPTLAVPGRSGLGLSANSSSRKEAPAASSSSAGAGGGDAPAAAPAASSSSSGGGSRALPAKKDAAGVRSFKTAVSPSAHDEGSDWESASTEEAAGLEHSHRSSKQAGLFGGVAQLLDEWFDPTSLALCGFVLAACAGSLLVLGSAAGYAGTA